MKLFLLIAMLFLLAACNLPAAQPSPTGVTQTAPPTLTPTLPPAPTTAPSPTAPPQGPQPTVDPFAIDIQIDPFPSGSTFKSPGPVWISGTVDRMPFEKNLTYQVLDASGRMVQEGPVAVAGEYGSPGTFTVKIDFPEGQVGEHVIRIVNFSAEDGREQGAAQVSVTLQ